MLFLEAMACGLPVITSDTCGGAEFIEQGIKWICHRCIRYTRNDRCNREYSSR